MLAIKFEADVHDGVIEIPVEYQEALKNHIEVIALVDERMNEGVQYSDEYIKSHWRELIITSNMGEDFEKSDVLQEQRAAFLMQKYK